MNVEEMIEILYEHVPYADKDIERIIAKLRADRKDCLVTRIASFF